MVILSSEEEVDSEFYDFLGKLLLQAFDEFAHVRSFGIRIIKKKRQLIVVVLDGGISLDFRLGVVKPIDYFQSGLLIVPEAFSVLFFV
jgi:hypothetical protein